MSDENEVDKLAIHIGLGHDMEDHFCCHAATFQELHLPDKLAQMPHNKDALADMGYWFVNHFLELTAKLEKENEFDKEESEKTNAPTSAAFQ